MVKPELRPAVGAPLPPQVGGMEESSSAQHTLAGPPRPRAQVITKGPLCGLYEKPSE